MNRKDFLSQLGLITAGTVILPSWLMSCNRDLFEDFEYDGKVVIIGAGAAGMYAAHTLKTNGVNCTVLEASSRIGGRLKKLDGFTDFPLDLGAEWLHGQRSIMADLVDATNTEVFEDNADDLLWFNNSFVEQTPINVDAIMNDAPWDESLTIYDYAQQRGLGPEYDPLLNLMAAEFGTSSKRVSLGATLIEGDKWTAGDQDYKFKKTYFDLLNDHIFSQVADRVQFNTAVSKIDYSTDIIRITDSNNNVIEADRVIITVPITVLKDGDIEFVPALPSEKTAAFQKMGMDAGLKVFLKFNITSGLNYGIAGGSASPGYYLASYGKQSNDIVLGAFIMGEEADEMLALGSDSAIINALLAELDMMTGGTATPNFQGGYVQNWKNEPFVRGAYSYPKVNIGNAREIAAQPVDNRLFFAGEAMHTDGHSSTVHGAVETGYREVVNFVNSVK